MSFNQANYERAEFLLLIDASGKFKLTPEQYKKCCSIVDYYISEKYLFLSNCKRKDAESRL